MRFRILGPLELTGDPDPASTGSHTPGAPKLRTVLGTLVARAGSVVSVDALIDELWPDGPPRTALTTLHVYVSQIRKALTAASPRQGRALLVTQRPGYLLRADAGDVDATVFEQLRALGRRALADGELARAADLLRRADALWRGPLLSGTPHGPLLRATAARLTEARLEVLELHVDAELRLGNHRAVLPELRALTTEHPLREEFHAQLLTALARTGRHAEALHAYARLRALLAEELGTEPGPRLRALHQRLLTEEEGAEGDDLLGYREQPVRQNAGAREGRAPMRDTVRYARGGAGVPAVLGGSAVLTGASAVRPRTGADVSGPGGDVPGPTSVVSGPGEVTPGTGGGVPGPGETVAESGAVAPTPNATVLVTSAAVPAPNATAPVTSAAVPAPNTPVPAPTAAAAGPSATTPAPVAVTPGPDALVPSPLVSPALALPAPDGELVGRDEELAAVERLLRTVPPGGWTAVTGPVGAGKTALAVAAARRVADAFPDGVLFLDLRTASRRPRTAPEAARHLLRHAGASALIGPRPPTLPGSDEHSDPVAALHALTSRRRLLLVLDGAVSAGQVRPLLPSAPGSTALVTGRLTATGAAGAHAVPLGPLDRAAVRRLLGPVARETADEIGELCGRMPLALRAAALALAARPHWDGDTLLARLREESTRLAVLDAGELDVRARLLEAHDDLPEDLRRALRLLALLPPGEFTTPTAAAVLGLGTHPAALLLDALADRRLLLPRATDAHLLPEPVRLLAADRLRALEPADAVRAATVRMCEACTTAAEEPGGAPRTAADTRRLALVLRTAHTAGLWSVVVRLADALTAPLERTADWAAWDTAHGLALDAARRGGDRRAEARLLCSLGDLAWQQRDDERAAERYGQAVAVAAAAGLADEQARALAGLAELRLERGESEHAAELLSAAPEPGGAVGRYEVQRVRALVALETAGGRAATGPLTECVALAAALGDRRREAHARRALRAVHGPPPAFEVRPGVWRLPPPRPVPA
jgi:DNA-binding SARP family transcriptional activator